MISAATIRPFAGSILRKQLHNKTSVSIQSKKACYTRSQQVEESSPCGYRNLSTIGYRSDKYRRTIRRRVIERTTPSSSSSSKKKKSRRKRNHGSFLTHLVFPKKLPKILVGSNVAPKLISYPPNPICITPSTITTTVLPPPVPPMASSASSSQAAASTIMASSSSSSASPSPSSSLATITTTTTVQGSPSSVQIRPSKKFIQWLRSNTDVLILNAGSIATLTAFSRTDILELRLLSIMGSTGTIVYFLSKPPSQRVYLPVLWSSIFFLTNSYMVYQVLEERNGQVSSPWDDIEHTVYHEHFHPYGVTPRQYERLLSKAQRRVLKRGTVLVQSGQVFESVYLVARGRTEATTQFAKRITAAGANRGRALVMKGGDSGAWVGEMTFLKRLSNGDFDSTTTVIGGEGGGGGDGSSGVAAAAAAAAGGGGEEGLSKKTAAMITALSPFAESLPSTSMEGAVSQSSSSSSSSSSQTTSSNDDDHDDNHHHNGTTNQRETNQPIPPPSRSTTHHSLLTYTATEDTIAFEWSYEDLAELLNTSAEFRSGVTRAMTAAVMGKVLNIYSSSSSGGSSSSSSSSSNKKNSDRLNGLSWWSGQ